MPANRLTERPEWNALSAHHATLSVQPLRDLLMNDPQRSSSFSIHHDGLNFDFSRHPVTADTVAALVALARACDVETARDAMLAGAIINQTEKRAVLHTALRRPATDSVTVNGENIMPFIHQTLARMKVFSEAVRSGAWKGHNGKRITDIVHIGIGGSDLGPRMVCRALGHLAHPDLHLHFVSNVDGAAIESVLKQCQPDTILFIIASKTFTTQETMANAHTARQWLLQTAPEAAVASHFVALSTNQKAVEDFGINAENMFPFGEWVGGRYSVWSAIGLPICIMGGFEVFRAFLDGAHAMDLHFQSAPLDKNIPVIMALLGIWQRNFYARCAQAIIPYDDRLSLLPGHLQQADMESNGKSADREGHRITAYETAPVLFGTAGTDAQHSYFQLLHQGTDIIPIDMIAACTADDAYPTHHDLLLANMAAQAQAFAFGKTLDEADGDINRAFDGNRPVSILLLDQLTPYHLGQLVAAYEHKIFVQGVIWNINSFDQFGVELGKEIAGQIMGEKNTTLPATTQSTLDYIKHRTR